MGRAWPEQVVEACTVWGSRLPRGPPGSLLGSLWEPAQLLTENPGEVAGKEVQHVLSPGVPKTLLGGQPLSGGQLLDANTHHASCATVGRPSRVLTGDPAGLWDYRQARRNEAHLSSSYPQRVEGGPFNQMLK